MNPMSLLISKSCGEVGKSKQRRESKVCTHLGPEHLSNSLEELAEFTARAKALSSDVRSLFYLVTT